MNSSNARRGSAVFSTLVLAVAPQVASAADGARTPHYSHALHELQFSRFALSNPSDTNVSGDQKRAATSVDRAIAELQNVGIVDTTELATNERAVSTRTQQERLNIAVNAIYAAKFDVTHYSENAPSEVWRLRLTSELMTAESATRTAAALPQSSVAAGRTSSVAGQTSSVASQPATVADARKQGPKGMFRPSYLYAIRDLEYAEKILGAPDLASDSDVQAALADIRSADGSFKQAAIDDGRSLSGKANVDANMSHMDRLHGVLALLHQVHTDVARHETNEAASDLENSAISHVDSATEHVKLAIARNDRDKR